MSGLYDNRHTFFEFPTHACDSSRPEQPPQGLPTPWVSLQGTLDIIDEPKLKHTRAYFTEALVTTAFQSIFMEWRFLKEWSLIRKEFNGLHTLEITVLLW